MNEDPLPLLSFSCQAELREENPECRVEGASAQVEEFEVLLGHHLIDQTGLATSAIFPIDVS